MKERKDDLSLGNLARRAKADTPKFWKKIRNIMIGVGVVSGTILAAPVALPAALIAVAGYGIAVGAVGASLAQLTEEKK